MREWKMERKKILAEPEVLEDEITRIWQLCVSDGTGQHLSPVYAGWILCFFLLWISNLRFPLQRETGSLPWSYDKKVTLGVLFGRKKGNKWQTQPGCWISMILFGSLKRNFLTALSLQPGLRRSFRLTAQECRAGGLEHLLITHPLLHLWQLNVKVFEVLAQTELPSFMNVILFGFKAPCPHFPQMEPPMQQFPPDCVQHGPQPAW